MKGRKIYQAAKGRIDSFQAAINTIVAFMHSEVATETSRASTRRPQVLRFRAQPEKSAMPIDRRKSVMDNLNA